MSGGFNPTVHLFGQSGGSLRFDDAIAAFVPDQSVQAEETAGAAGGTFSTAGAVLGGHAAGVRAAEATGWPSSQTAPSVTFAPADAAIEPRWFVSGGHSKAFVDFQNDVSVDDILLSARESFVSVEHLKRYTTLGMATDQGKTSNVNALAIMASLTGRGIGQAGTTRFRFPFTPVPLASFAGRNRGELYRPRRRLACYDCHTAAGAVFAEFSDWMRPLHYLRPEETARAAMWREALAVRTTVGLFDSSPLGKIEVYGKDAARFLDLIYANTMSTLNVGKIRYGLMLGEDGSIIDDGVAARLGKDHFLVGTSSGGASRIADWMEEWLQCEWTDLDVLVAPITTAWSVITIAGPRAGDVLDALGNDFDTSTASFPHMSLIEGRIAGLHVRVMRVSYTGEVSYEINVPTGEAASLWDRALKVGAQFGITPVGIDAWESLRTEKGYPHIGVDTDGTTTPLDIGWGHILKKKNDFVGKRSLLRPENQRPDRLQLVGFDSEADLEIGAHVVGRDGRSEGYITSATFGAAIKRPVAIGMLRAGVARKGQQVIVRTATGIGRVTVVDPAFYDPTGERLNG
jgi:sarcosine oxidase subunit alpha